MIEVGRKYLIVPREPHSLNLFLKLKIANRTTLLRHEIIIMPVFVISEIERMEINK